MKKMLMLATVPSMIGQFNMTNISILLDMGYEVHVACDWTDRSVWTEEKVNNLKNTLSKLKVEYFQIDYSRAMFHFLHHYNSYRQTKELLQKNRYEFIHCHTPIASAIARLACKETNVKCIYTAHGFHFFKGAPLKNWLIFYPIEKWLSRYTDILITINKEDYYRAKNKFYAKKVEYIPGVGVDLNKFRIINVNKNAIRESINVPESAFLMLSVGELSSRKNHQIVIRALSKLKNKDIYYCIVGTGEDNELYKKMIKEFNLNENVFLLGFRSDIKELCLSSDCFVHPSVREGLGIAPLEGMACGLPLISSYVNGIRDYTKDGVSGCCINPNDCEEVITAIKKMYADKEFRDECGKNNLKTVEKFSLENSKNIMKSIYYRINQGWII